jgi:O-antigen ligase
MSKHPLLGVGPDHFPLVVHEYGWPKGKEAHSLWMQIGAELGLPGLGLLLAYYGLVIKRLWPIARGVIEMDDPWLRHLAQMVIVSTTGYAVSAQFVSLEALEPPYYIAMMGAGVLALTARASVTAPATARRMPALSPLPQACVEPQFAL